jgi:IS4 transposase
MSPSSSRSKEHNSFLKIKETFNKIPFNKIAKSSGFCVRKSRKLKPKLLVLSFLNMISIGKCSYPKWAQQAGTITGKTVSKQGIWKRVNKLFVLFLYQLIIYLFRNKICNSTADKKDKKFKKIHIQDSTSLCLPESLKYYYAGTVTHGKITSQLKIQTIYDINNNNFEYFALTPFTNNDQSRTADIYSVAQSNDLVLRDLGYFSLESFKVLDNKGIYFISKLKYGVSLFDLERGNQINLIKKLNNSNRVDEWVYIGSVKKIKVRLVAIKLHQEHARARKQKAKNDRDKRLNHDQNYYKLLEYNIYITNIPQADCSPNEIRRYYQLRWRIETIFKCWKSNNHLQQLMPNNLSHSKNGVEAAILLSLLSIMIFSHRIFQSVENIWNNSEFGTISIQKLTAFVNDNFKFAFDPKNEQKIMTFIQYYCCYEIRSDRSNYIQKLSP